jgi:phosphatidylserine/phosphatidylglycerophosphate/cardiolipin synthase-like enzyme
MAQSTCTVPSNVNNGNTVVCTGEWFLNKSEYHVQPCSYELLINGEAAFGAVYDAINAAKTSVSLICWGFQPSMYFKRDGSRVPLSVGMFTTANVKTTGQVAGNLTIGQLLEKKAAEGVMVRVLSWADRLALTNVSIVPVSGEVNTPGASVGVGGSRNFGGSDEQYEYDKAWFSTYNINGLARVGDPKQEKALKTRFRNPELKDNLEFRMRGFDPGERKAIASQDFDDALIEVIGLQAKALFFAAPSHHQKICLVDYEDPENHVGFVMGHNCLDEYWDTSRHSYYRKAGNAGRNGSYPREDLSARITGSIIGDLYYNFNEAWTKEGAPAMPAADFAKYKPHPVGGGDFAAKLCQEAQIVRTQPQYGIQNVKKMYLQNVENATQYIYCENQYFRWLTFAETIKAHAAKLSAAGKDPGKYGNLYLFVITNSSEEGMGAGAKKTYSMMESLGRTDTMPGVKKNRLDEEIKQLDKDIALKEKLIANTAKTNPKYAESEQGQQQQKELEEMKAQREEKTNTRDALIKNPDTEVLAPEDRPGLKTRICTLVPPDTPPLSQAKVYANKLDRRIGELMMAIPKAKGTEKEMLEEELAETKRQRATANTYKAPEEKVANDILRWPEVYVHSKLMIIDDTFMTNGSSNINTRSMQVDSELNIIHANHLIAGDARRELWRIHTGGEGASDNIAKAFEAWGDIIVRNQARESKQNSPIASLRGFKRTSPSETDRD